MRSQTKKAALILRKRWGGQTEKELQVPTLRQELEKIKARLPINEFRYDPETRKFWRFGQVWKPAGVDAVVGPVDGMRASVWLKFYGARR